jgi:hypothetical protein
LGEYYIGVFGKTGSSYKLTVKNEDHSIYLKAGLSESGYMEEYETKVLYFRDPILAKENVSADF